MRYWITFRKRPFPEDWQGPWFTLSDHKGPLYHRHTKAELLFLVPSEDEHLVEDLAKDPA